MTEIRHIPISFYIVAAISMVYFVYNLRRLLVVTIGKKVPERVFNLGNIIYNILFFGVGQRKVFSVSFTFASIMHFFLAWGFFELLFATTVDFLTARGFFLEFLPGLDTPWFAFLNDLGGLMLLVGLLMAIYRRTMDKPELLPQDHFKGRMNFSGDTGILLILLFLVIGGFLAEASRLSVDYPPTAIWSWIGYPISKMLPLETWTLLKPWLWWIHAVTSLLFISILPTTKMFHALAVIFNVALTNRKKHGNIRPMHVSKLMEDPVVDIENINLGAGSISDLTWKQLLDSTACTECSRCTSVCPATETGKPLSPMKLITDIRHNLYLQELEQIDTDNLVGEVISETELWSCTTCAACMDVCPVLVEHVPTIIDMRRHLVLSEGKPPEQASESLEKTMQNGNPWGFSKNDRLKWAKDAGIDIPILSEKKSTDVLYWVGCAGAYDPRNQKVSKSMVQIFNASDIDYAVLGKEESCTGDSARRMGEEYLFETQALKNIDTLNKYEFNTIVTTCPHCYHTLQNEYSDFGGNYFVKHHTEFINEIMNSNKLSTGDLPGGKFTYHDACYLGRHNGIYDSPRDILSSLTKQNGTVVEMPRNKENSSCCGAGGGNMWYEINEGDRINVSRFNEAEATGADTVVTACSFCTIMMDDAMKSKGKEENMSVLDIAEITAKSLNSEIT